MCRTTNSDDLYLLFLKTVGIDDSNVKYHKKFKNDRNSIFVKLNNGSSLIFSCSGGNKWRLESYEAYMYGLHI